MTVRIRVFDSRINRINAPGGDVNRHMQSIRRDAETLAHFYCPRRTGELEASISSSSSFNQHGVFVNLKASAPYAKYVHDGTATPIVPRTKPYLRWVGWGPYGGRVWRRKMVRGQGSTPFLRAAARDALRNAGV